ncbi:MAG TPA: TetR/AcrR family transcriptional regulator [Acidimicrobiia bacterium]
MTSGVTEDAERPAPGVARPPGRPRRAEVDEAILAAAVDLFAEGGLDGLTVEGVAARANVGKATIYRRYPCKVDLVIAASKLFTVDGDGVLPDTGTTRGDLRVLVDWVIAMLTTTPLGRALPMMVSDRARVPELADAHREMMAEKRARHRAALQRGVDRGDLRADADLELMIDSYVGPIFYRFLITDAPLDDAFADELVEHTLRAFSA